MSNERPNSEQQEHRHPKLQQAAPRRLSISQGAGDMGWASYFDMAAWGTYYTGGGVAAPHTTAPPTLSALQRLLRLRHASKCQAETGMCRATQHCDQMKKLWRHGVKCKDAQCQTS